MPQEPFHQSAFNPFAITAAEQFARNPQKRCACALVLDVSGSMDGEPLRELQAGLSALGAVGSAASVLAGDVAAAIPKIMAALK